MKFFERNFNQKFVWIVVIFSILLSLVGTRIELAGGNLIDHPLFKLLLSPLDDVRYGHFIARKLFLVVIAFLVFGYWLTKQKNILQAVKSNIKYIISIGVILFASRILTFGFWFYNDDLRFFHYHLFAPTQQDFNPQAMWGPIGLHPIALLLLVLNWFGANYTLYNSLGLLFYFLAGIAIFALVNKFQTNKFISLTAALFFLTTPTYFQGRLLIGEVINSPFILLLVILAIYMLLQRFIPGALIFAAAALEYGVAKSYFIALPLILFTVFFTWPRARSISATSQKSSSVFFIVAILLISLVYLPAFGQAPNASGRALTLDQLVVYGDVLMSVVLPYILTYPLVHLLSLILNDWIYITAVLGFLVIAGLLIVGATSYIHGKVFSVKLIIIALSIILPTAAIASFMGVRVDHNVAKLVLYSNNGNVPSGATGYGVFPALGLTLTLVALGYVIKKKAYRIFAIVLIVLSTIGSIAADYKWSQSPYGYPQRRYDEQLQKILPRDGSSKYVYIPGQQRPFFEGTRTFASVFRGDQGIFVFMGAEEFVKTLEENKIQKDDIYFLVSNGKPQYDIYDYSDKIRVTPYEHLIPLVKSLTQELAPSGIEF